MFLKCSNFIHWSGFFFPHTEHPKWIHLDTIKDNLTTQNPAMSLGSWKGLLYLAILKNREIKTVLSIGTVGSDWNRCNLSFLTCHWLEINAPKTEKHMGNSVTCVCWKIIYFSWYTVILFHSRVHGAMELAWPSCLESCAW